MEGVSVGGSEMRTEPLSTSASSAFPPPLGWQARRSFHSPPLGGRGMFTNQFFSEYTISPFSYLKSLIISI